MRAAPPAPAPDGAGLLTSRLRRRRWLRRAGLLLALLGAPWAGNAAAGASTAPQRNAQGAALLRASHAVLGVEVQVVDGARTAEALGVRRQGSGVVIGADGLVLTIGYLLLEADTVDLVLDDGRRLPARVVAVDAATGFGLLQALVPLKLPVAPLARQVTVKPGERLLLASGGDDGSVSVAQLAGRHPFSGHWEYHVDNALFTKPARTDHAGAGLFNGRGELLGIGSVLVLDTPTEYEQGPGSMFVPVDLLLPVLAELRQHGMSAASHRAWLGVSCTEDGGTVQVVRVAADSPAEAAGLQAGDRIVGIDGVPVRGLEAFYKQLWRGGRAERDLMLQLQRYGEPRQVPVHSVDRVTTLKQADGI